MKHRLSPKLRIAAVVTAGTLCVAGLSGCGEQASTATDDTETTATVATSSGQAVSSTSTTTTTTETVPTPTFDFSKGIDDDGHWDGIRALDYVTLCDYSNIQIPSSALDVSEKVESRIESITSNAGIDELTDEWVAENFSSSHGWSTVEELRAGLTETYQEDAEKTYIQDYIVENSTFSEVPEAIVSYQSDYLVYQYTYMASQYNFTLESLISMMYGYSSSDELVENRSDDILSQSKMYLAFQAIAETEGRTVSDEELENYFAHYQGVSDISDYVEQYGKPYLKMTALMDLTLQDIVDNATVVDDSDSADSTATETGESADKADEKGDAADTDATDSADSSDAKASTSASSTGTADKADADSTDSADSSDAKSSTSAASSTASTASSSK